MRNLNRKDRSRFFDGHFYTGRFASEVNHAPSTS
jgi:hypothetical protein